MIKLLLGKFLFFLGFLGLGQLCVRQTEDFTILGISSKRPRDPSLQIRNLSPEEISMAKQAFNQKYRYLCCGGQAFVFLSDDQKYILKLFKQKCYSAPLWTRCLPDFLPYKKKKIAAKEARFRRDFITCKLAFEQIPKQTGTLFAHLDKTNDFGTTLTIVDKIGIEHPINIDDFDFVLQEKAEPATGHLDLLMNKHDLEGAKQAISSLLETIADRTKNGVVDRFPNLFKNFGFVGDRAVEFDIGRFMPGNTQLCLPRLRVEFGQWLQARYPELASHWESEFDRLFKQPAI